ncbi:divalent-cation tolerance protein CutA [Synechococcus sp. Nb3U1]|uniref:divalent-cation tolerance protein CutA n=1 Tax=Synechococcus sp. Nb3U1 TaxID=1914529 RepID=UPI001F33457C|nr:divalent-cation tolerance protein CutA [Synechococcus sp. Nb3U1]MCF2970173.1 divalent-cation tolerance protein CutA [Synechococcus sp. Nb3U1]
MATPQEPTEQPHLMVVMTTVGSAATAQQLAHTLVAERCVACAQVLPSITSFYRWQGSLQTDSETLILFKLPAGAYSQLEQRLRELHPYDEPEIVALAAAQVSPTYLAWALEQVG